MRSFDFYLDPPDSVRRIFRITLGAESGSELYKLGWRQIFEYAKQVSAMYRKEKKDVSPELIVDSWAADCMWLGCEGNTITSDDRHTGFCSTGRSLTQQWEDDYERQLSLVNNFRIFNDKLNEEPKAPLHVRKHYLSELKNAERELTIIKRLRPSTVSFDALETYGADASFDHDEHEFAEEYANNVEARLSFSQEYEVDPDDARFLGTPPKSDNWEDKIKSDFRDRKRGSSGTLGGVYENTLPEPAYSKNPYRRRQSQGRWYTLPPKGWENKTGSWDSQYIPN